VLFDRAKKCRNDFWDTGTVGFLPALEPVGIEATLTAGSADIAFLF
jgi:hypothetical protein